MHVPLLWALLDFRSCYCYPRIYGTYEEDTAIKYFLLREQPGPLAAPEPSLCSRG